MSFANVSRISITSWEMVAMVTSDTKTTFFGEIIYHISVPLYKLFVMCHLYASCLRIIGIHIQKLRQLAQKKNDSKIHLSIRSVATLHRNNTAQHHQPNKVPLPSKQGQRWTVEHPRFSVDTGSAPTLEVEQPLP